MLYFTRSSQFQKRIYVPIDADIEANKIAIHTAQNEYK